MQVFSNIVGNAIKFTPSGGRVEIDVTGDGSLVEFAVSDNGPGISSSDLPHLFDRYWQARTSPRTGTGLGLPIAKRIIEAHDGFLRVESELGQGTRFTFALPAVLQPDNDPPVPVGRLDVPATTELSRNRLRSVETGSEPSHE